MMSKTATGEHASAQEAPLHPLEKTLLTTLRRRNLVQVGDKGVVAVSGGADSLALLYLLSAIKDRLHLSLEVLHFDHGLRAESAAEAQWVGHQVKALGLPFYLLRHAELATRHHGIQAAARQWRQEEAERLCKRIGAHWVASGHQQDDQNETLLLKLLRGCHLSHLKGMPWRSGFMLRPLLDIPHSNLTAYLRQRGLDWREDPSNQDTRYLRNRVRYQLLPLLEDMGEGGIRKHLLGLAAQAEALHHWLEQLPQPLQSAPGASPPWISVPELGALPSFAATSCLQRFISAHLPAMVGSATLFKALHLLTSPKTSWELHLPQGWCLRQAGERLLLEAKDPTAAEEELHISEQGWRIRFAPPLRPRVCPEPCGEDDALLVHNLPSGALLELRPRQKGDRFHPPWREHALKLKDFLQGQKIPLWQRDRLSCLVWEQRLIALSSGVVAQGFFKALPGQSTAKLCLHLSPSGAGLGPSFS